MLNVICERIGTKYRPEAVDILYDMISRNLPEGTEGEFHLYTDQPDTYGPEIIIHGLGDFRLPGLRLTLDHLIVGPLDEIAVRGLLFEEDVWFYWGGPFPHGARIIKCMGKPPQEMDGWVRHVWKIGGGTIAEQSFIPNVPKADLADNILSAMARDCKWFEPKQAHDDVALIVGGGPSLKDDAAMIRRMTWGDGGHVFAINAVPEYLYKHGVTSNFHVMLDAHPQCLKFVFHSKMTVRYYASQCDPTVLDAAGDSLICWHGGGEVMESLGERGMVFRNIVCGGTTAATRAMVLAYGLGYRKFHLFGLDSSYDGDIGHAYEQGDYAKFLEATVGEETFKTSPQLLGQAEDFKMVIPHLISAACEITVHGKGLLKAVAIQMAD